MRGSKVLLVCLMYFVCHGVSAQIVFNEIMYDGHGSDYGKEWIELKNVGSEALSIATTTWKIIEAGTNHSLVLERGSTSVSALGFVIIVDDVSKFLLDWPNFPGTIFSSSFSLSNIGETLILKGSNGLVMDTVIYKVPAKSAEGYSLQKLGGNWQVAPPTPGFENIAPVIIPAIDSAVVSPPKVSGDRSAVMPIKVDKVVIPNNKILPLQEAQVGKFGKELDMEESDLIKADSLLGNKSDSSIWFYILGGIIILSILGVFLLKSEISKEEGNSPDEFEIIE